MIGPDGPRNAREMDEWLTQRQREQAEADAYYAAYADTHWAEQEMLHLEQCDADLDNADKAIAALSAANDVSPLVATTRSA